MFETKTLVALGLKLMQSGGAEEVSGCDQAMEGGLTIAVVDVDVVDQDLVRVVDVDAVRLAIALSTESPSVGASVFDGRCGELWLGREGKGRERGRRLTRSWTNG